MSLPVSNTTNMLIQAVPAVLYFALFYCTGTILFDCVHYLFHVCTRSRSRILRRIGRIHNVHHLYFDRHLKYNDKYKLENMFTEMPLELGCQILGAWLVSFYLPQTSFITNMLRLTIAIQTIRVIIVALLGGKDSNHITFSTIPKNKNWLFVGPEYHALHHVYPNQFMSSMLPIFDWFAGTSTLLKNRTVAMTGHSGAFGAALAKELESHSVKRITPLRYGVDYSHTECANVISTLAETDILILSHGSKGPDANAANNLTSRALVTAFLEARKSSPNPSIVLPEIWYVGSEAEIHPSWGNPVLQRYSASKRAFLPFAKGLYNSEKVVYRHIVPSAFRSPMSPGAVISARTAARVALFWMRRGACYVPVTYTGFAFLGWFKFVFFTREGAR